MSPQPGTRRRWASFLGRYSFALGILVVVPLIVMQWASLFVHAPLARGSRGADLKKLLDFEQEMERRGDPIRPTPPPWPPQDPPVRRDQRLYIRPFGRDLQIDQPLMIEPPDLNGLKPSQSR